MENDNIKENTIICDVFKNCIRYKIDNNRNIKIMRAKFEDDTESIVLIFRKLIILKSEEERQDLLRFDSPFTKLIHRPYSKYCIWKNNVTLSPEMFYCIIDSAQHIDSIIETKVMSE